MISLLDIMGGYAIQLPDQSLKNPFTNFNYNDQ